MILRVALTDLPIEEPSWMYDSRGVERSPLYEAAELLSSLDGEDLDVFVLSYGFGMRLGVVAQTLRLDPAIVFWRIDRALTRWVAEHDTSSSPASLEVGVTDLLRGAGEDLDDLPPPPSGRASWSARELVDELDESVQARLASRLEQTSDADVGVSGIGVGSLLLIALVAVGFAAFGIIRDIYPYERGRNLMSEGRFVEARSAFTEAGDTPEVRRMVFLCWLAEGDFERALAMLASGAEIPLGSYMPYDPPLPVAEPELGSLSLLPRGPISKPRPTFLVGPGPMDELVVQAMVDGHPRRQMVQIPARDAPTEVPYPDAWFSLPEGPTTWHLASEADARPAQLDLLPPEVRKGVRKKLKDIGQSREVPQQAKPFLIGHYLLNRRLYMDAGREFATLAETFPEAAYPRDQARRLAEALGVDTQHLLR